MKIISLWGEEYLVQQIIFYGNYHKEWRNAMIHNIFVPIILFCGYLLLYSIHHNIGYAAAVFYALVYCSIDLFAGVSYVICMILPLISVGEYLFVHYSVHTIRILSAIMKIFSWIMQIGGHVFFEKNRPAFFESMFQSFVTAPLFVWYKSVLFPYFPNYYKDVNRKIYKKFGQKFDKKKD
jgi:uncharacterized membrane protein YGL010W